MTFLQENIWLVRFKPHLFRVGLKALPSSPPPALPFAELPAGVRKIF
jgi:hypothetical protein